MAEKDEGRLSDKDDLVGMNSTLVSSDVSVSDIFREKSPSFDNNLDLSLKVPKKGKVKVSTQRLHLGSVSPRTEHWITMSQNCSTPRTISNPVLYLDMTATKKEEILEHARLRRKCREFERLSLERSTANIDDVRRNMIDDYSCMQKRCAAVERIITSVNEKGNLAAEAEQLNKIARCYEQIKQLMVNVMNVYQDGPTTRTGEEISLDSRRNIDHKEVSKQKQFRTYFDRYQCIVGSRVDEQKHTVMSAWMEQMTRIMDDRETTKDSKVSLSSGSLADHSSSISDSNSVQSLPKIASFQFVTKQAIPESSLSSSSNSSFVQNQPIKSDQFQMPMMVRQKLEPNKSKSCYCKCFCSLIKQNYSKSSFSSDSELLASSVGSFENLNPEQFKENSGSLVKPTLENITVAPKEASSETQINKIKEGEFHQDPNDLLVFAKWTNRYYPGRIEGVSEDEWHEAEHPLRVVFCDSNVKHLANVFIVPATRLPQGTEVKCNLESDTFEDAKLVKMERFINSKGEKSLKFIVSIGDDVKAVPFENIWLSELVKRQLYVTPRRPQVMKVGTPWHLIHGKRSCHQLETKTPQTSGNNQESHISTVKRVERHATTVPTKRRRTTISSDFKKSVTRVVRDVKGASSKQECTQKNARSQKLKRKLELQFEPKPEPGPSTRSAVVQLPNIIKSSSSDRSSGVDLSDENKIDNFGDSELDMEYMGVCRTVRKCLDPSRIKSIKKLKSKNKVEEEEVALNHELGPIPNNPIFEGYHFVITHSERTRLHSPVNIKTKGDSFKLNSSTSDDDRTDLSTDVETQLRSCASFDYVRLEAQITAGKGALYKHVADIKQEDYSKTITISDYPCRTPNYLLSVALEIPIYRHDTIINCCKEDVPIKRMLKFSHYMPNGRSLETGKFIYRCYLKNKKPLSGYMCTIRLSTSQKFWRTILSAMGAVVVQYGKYNKAYGNNISFILGEKGFSIEDYSQIVEERVPLLSKEWAIQTLIHAEPRTYLDCPKYNLNS